MNTSLKKLIQTDKSFSDYSVAYGSAKAFKRFLTNQAIMLPQNSNPVYGIKAIFESMSLSDPKDVLSWVPKGGRVAESGELGYTWGLYTLKTASGNITQGKYLNIWSKQTNGSWKVDMDMGNTNTNS
ncbi:MAG: hypothetical protein WC489_03880 [Patescibacteria group bacterium]